MGHSQKSMPAISKNPDLVQSQSLVLSVIKGLLPPLGLIFAVLGSIMSGVATPTEAASLGALGAMILALVRGELNWLTLRDVCAKHHSNCQHGFYDSDQRLDFFAGLPWFRWRRDDYQNRF